MPKLKYTPRWFFNIIPARRVKSAMYSNLGKDPENAEAEAECLQDDLITQVLMKENNA
jgi:hypothetical protein